MNFVTKQIINDLKSLIELKKLIEQTSMSDNSPIFMDFIKREIEQHIKDLIHSEKL